MIGDACYFICYFPYCKGSKTVFLVTEFGLLLLSNFGIDVILNLIRVFGIFKMQKWQVL